MFISIPWPTISEEYCPVAIMSVMYLINTLFKTFDLLEFGDSLPSVAPLLNNSGLAITEMSFCGAVLKILTNQYLNGDVTD